MTKLTLHITGQAGYPYRLKLTGDTYEIKEEKKMKRMKAYDLIRQAIEQNILEGKEYIKDFLGGTQGYLTDLTYREFMEDVYDGDSASFKSEIEYIVTKMRNETADEFEITDALEAIDGNEIVSYRKILNTVKKEHFR